MKVNFQKQLDMQVLISYNKIIRNKKNIIQILIIP